jgi:hypothetical protein
MLLHVLQVCTLGLVALAMAPAVAHALELPGKMRLSPEAYRIVQPIYYPGFTWVGGVAEIASIVATFGLLFAAAGDSEAFWLTLSAFLALLLMQVVFWMFTQPVNRIWLRDERVGKAGSWFFGIGAGAPNPDDWVGLRDRWEYSHVARAVFALIAVVLMAASIAAV